VRQVEGVEIQAQLYGDYDTANSDEEFYRRACTRFVTKVETMVSSAGNDLDLRERHEFFDALKRVAQDSGLDNVPHRLAKELGERFESLRGMYVTFYQELEYRAAQKIVANQENVESVFRSHNHALLRHEALEANISEEATIGFVGCGCLPWSAIALHQLFGADVYGFDRDHELVGLGGAVVERLGIQRAVRIHACEGDAIDFSQFSHVYLAGMCDQKLTIIERVSAGLRAGGKLLIRSSRSPYQIFYPQFTARALPGFTFMRMASCGEVEELETLIFEKN